MNTELQARMSISAASIKAEAQAQEDKKTPTFFEKNRPKLLSGQADQEYAEAKALGKAQAKNFMKAVHDPSEPDHARNVDKYISIHGRDPKKVEQDFVDKCSAELNSPDPADLKEDPAYEANLEKEHKPQGNVSVDDIAFFDILKTNLKKSRDLRGYGRGKMHDKEVVQNWKDKYGRK